MQQIDPGPIVLPLETPPSLLKHAILFHPADRQSALQQLPEGCGVFALFAEDKTEDTNGVKGEPYLAKASNLHRRLQRFLSPAPSQSRRLQLAERIRRIEYTVTGSDFASDLVFYRAAKAVETMFGAAAPTRGRDAKTRLRLRPPAFLKLRMENAYPRAVISTSVGRPAARALVENEPVGPFPSKAAAERYLEQVLDLFLLRRCIENLDPNPAHPGCLYSEMKKCLAPCYQGCTDERYAEEAVAVRDFLRTRGTSLLEKVALERTAAAEALEFEQAAALHQRYEKVEAVAAQMPDGARPLSQLSGVIIQPGSAAEQVDLFAITRGQLTGPVAYSALGMRLHNEQSGSSSLFTQPMALEAIPLAEDGSVPAIPKEASKDMLEARLDEALSALQPFTNEKELNDHISLFARWYYRPSTRRIGEVIFHDGEGALPRRAVVRAISRVAAATQFGVPAKAAKWHA
jgi:excinuclease ABC subunit C